MAVLDVGCLSSWICDWEDVGRVDEDGMSPTEGFLLLICELLTLELLF